MTNNTDAQIARAWAERAANLDPQDDVPIEGYRSAARYILATTTPPTIVDLDWDDQGGLNEKKIPLIDKDSVNDGKDSVNDKTASHPVTLVTEEDYENAPAGTIVVNDYWGPWVKDDMGFWLRCGECDGETSAAMAMFFARRVLRWGRTL